MLQKVKETKLRIPESNQFFGDVLGVCKKADPVALNFQAQFLGLEESHQELNKSFKKQKASMRTAELALLDARRDDAIICLRKLVDGYTNHHDESKKVAGKLLKLTIDKYGRQISKMNYQAETSVLDNVVVDLEDGGEKAAAVTLLGVSDTVAEIKASNGLFSATFLDRVGEDAAKAMVASGELVMECRGKYELLAKHIEANATINPSGAYTSLINELNALIEKFNTLLAIRQGRKNGDE